MYTGWLVENFNLHREASSAEKYLCANSLLVSIPNYNRSNWPRASSEFHDTRHSKRGGPMKTSPGSKGDRKDLLIAEDMTRRKFLKAGVGFAAIVSGLEMIAGCATTETPKVMTLVYPPLP